MPYPVECSCLDLDPKTRAFVFADLDYFKNIDPRLCAWLWKSAHSGLEMGSFGTDAGVLLKAGILLGRRFTIHWGAHAVFAERFPEVLPLQNLLEVDGRFYTSAGGLSSADMMIELLTSHMGQTFGVRIADHILGSTPRTIDTLQRQSTALRYGTRNPAFWPSWAKLMLMSPESFRLNVSWNGTQSHAVNWSAYSTNTVESHRPAI